jgi:VWFA-related protein
VDLLVQDGNRPVAGLTAADFELRDSGVVQKIESVMIGDVAVSMLLVLDTSTSVEGPALARLKEASQAAFDALGPEDRAALLSFSSPVTLQAPWGPPSAFIREGVSALQAGGATSLYDAAFAALTYRDTVTGNRNLIVLFSDGADTASWLPPHAALDKARRTDVVLYTVVVGHSGRDVTLQYRSGVQLRAVPDRPVYESTPFIEELAELTGGSMFVRQDTDELRETFTAIVKEFRSRYLLTYTPQGVDRPGWHPIEVKLKNRKGRVQARRGYSK